MTADSSPTQALLRMQRKNHFIGTGAMFMGLVLHCLVTWSLPPKLLIALSLCCVALLLTGVGVGSGRLSMKWGGVISGCVALVGVTLLVHLSGGPTSPYFQVFVTLPFILSTLTPSSLLPTLVGGGAGLAAAVTVNLMAGVSPAGVILQATSCCTLMGTALFGSRMYRRMMEAQQAAHDERLRALDQLAESERLRGRAERERAEVDRLVLVGQLAAGVAHEVNNPLAYVKANLSHLQREARSLERPLDRQELQEVLDETQHGVLRIQQIVTDLRGFSRAGSLEHEEGGRLEEAVGEAQRLVSMRLREGTEMQLALAPGLPTVRLGQRHLVQVMVNLLVNAADAVEMALPARPVRITVSARPVAGGVSLQVDDNGPGIAQDVLPRLFEPFFTTKPPGKGTGLGLALCREYVSRAGGTLHAENHPGGGARFVMRLPAEEAPATLLA